MTIPGVTFPGGHQQWPMQSSGCCMSPGVVVEHHLKRGQVYAPCGQPEETARYVRIVRPGGRRTLEAGNPPEVVALRSRHSLRSAAFDAYRKKKAPWNQPPNTLDLAA